MKLRKVIATTLVGVMAFGLAGCGNKSSNTGGNATGTPDTTKQSETPATETPTTAPTEAPVEAKKVTLKVWSPQEDQAPRDGYDKGILAAMCEAFDEAHPEWDITFEYGVCSEGDAKDTVTKDVAAAADVYMYANDQIPTLVDSGALARLGGSTVDEIKANNDEAMVSSVTYKDAVYGVPFTPNTWFMYYDKSKFTEDEIKSLDTMMAKDLGDGVSNFAMRLDNSWYIASFYYAAGCTLFGDGTQPDAGCDFDNENGVAVTKYLVNLAANKKYSNEKDGSSIAKFKEGKLGAFFTGSWEYDAIKEALGDNLGVAKIPTIKINGTDGQMKSFAGSKAIGVNPMSKNTDVAVALAAYLGNAECQQIRFNTRKIVPTDKTVAASAEVQSDALVAAQALEISEAAVVQPLLAEMGNYWTPAESLGKEIVQGDVTEANAAEKTAAMVKGILGK